MAQINPYNLFFNWLFDYNLKSEIPREVIENKNQFSIHFMINMLMKYKRTCLFVNEYLNNYNFVTLNFVDMIKIIKYIVYTFKLTKNDIVYSKFKYTNKNKDIKEIQKRYPYIKISEIEMFYEEYKKLHMENVVSKKSKKQSKSKNKNKISLKDINSLFDNKVKCNQCPLLENPFVLFETNRKSNCYNIDVMFISYKPDEKDLKNRKPFSGSKYTQFKKYISSMLVKNKKSYFYTYLIPCYHNEGEYFKFCQNRILELIKNIEPKEIVLLGNNVINNFQVDNFTNETNGTKLKSNFLNKDVYCIHHPYVLKEGKCTNEYEKMFTNLI